jgi:hypothetical protein
MKNGFHRNRCRVCEAELRNDGKGKLGSIAGLRTSVRQKLVPLPPRG